MKPIDVKTPDQETCQMQRKLHKSSKNPADRYKCSLRQAIGDEPCTKADAKGCKYLKTYNMQEGKKAKANKQPDIPKESTLPTE